MEMLLLCNKLCISKVKYKKVVISLLLLREILKGIWSLSLFLKGAKQISV